MAKPIKTKWKKATGSEGAISVKGGAYPVKGTGVGGGKVRGEVSPTRIPKNRKQEKPNLSIKELVRGGGSGGIRKKERIAKLKVKLGNIKTKVDNLEIRQKKVLAERERYQSILIDMKNVVKAKSPSKIVHSAKVAAIGAGLVAAGYAIPKKKKSPVVIKKKSPVVRKKLRMDIIGQPSQWINNK